MSRTCSDCTASRKDDQVELCTLHAVAELVNAIKRAYELEKANHGMTSHAYAYQQAIAHAEGRG